MSVHHVCSTESQWNGFRTANASPPPLTHQCLSAYTAAAKLKINSCAFVDLLLFLLVLIISVCFGVFVFFLL